VRAASGGDLSSSSLDDGMGGVSGVPLALGKTPMGWRTPMILPRWLARRGRQHIGVATAKTATSVLSLNEQNLDQCKCLL
jgi:hypothetical protein